MTHQGVRGEADEDKLSQLTCTICPCRRAVGCSELGEHLLFIMADGKAKSALFRPESAFASVPSTLGSGRFQKHFIICSNNIVG